MEQQPTADEIRIAFGIAIELEGIAGAQSQAKVDLKRIRDRKTTWVGVDENRLRFAVDKYLRGESCGI